MGENEKWETDGGRRRKKKEKGRKMRRNGFFERTALE